MIGRYITITALVCGIISVVNTESSFHNLHQLQSLHNSHHNINKNAAIKNYVPKRNKNFKNKIQSSTLHNSSEINLNLNNYSSLNAAVDKTKKLDSSLKNNSQTKQNYYNFEFAAASHGPDTNNKRSTHICPREEIVTFPVITDFFLENNELCQSNKICQKQGYRRTKQRKVNQIIQECCPGWERISKTDSTCDKDINECMENKPCDQLCYNTEGSFYCKCRKGFILGSDRQSCRKINDVNLNAFEVEDLEENIMSNNGPGKIHKSQHFNNLEFFSRLHQLEKNMVYEKSKSNELEKNIHILFNAFNSIKARLNAMEQKRWYQ